MPPLSIFRIVLALSFTFGQLRNVHAESILSLHLSYNIKSLTCYMYYMMKSNYHLRFLFLRGVTWTPKQLILLCIFVLCFVLELTLKRSSLNIRLK